MCVDQDYPNVDTDHDVRVNICHIVIPLCTRGSLININALERTEELHAVHVDHVAGVLRDPDL